MSVNVLPLIIYNIKGEQVKNSRITIEEPCFYFYSYQNFDVRISKVYNESGKLIAYYNETPKSQLVPGDFVGEIVEVPVKNTNIKIISESMELDKGAIGNISIPNLYSVLFKTRTYEVPDDPFLETKKTITENYYETCESIEFTGLLNFGYTLHIPNDGYSVELVLTNQDGYQENYIVTLNIPKESKRELYDDLIINKHLPTYDELIKAVAPNSEKREIVKRMLLDFNTLLSSKGTTAAINNFFYFIGFLREQISVYEEYKQSTIKRKSIYEKTSTYLADITTAKIIAQQSKLEQPSTNIGKVYQQNLVQEKSKLQLPESVQTGKFERFQPKNVLDVEEVYYTLNPDRTVDEKTGNYYVRFNNWDDGKQDGKQALNENNMPYRPFSVRNLDELYECLKFAIPLANKYFTSEEQHITFFGITYSVNLMLLSDVATLMHQIYESRVNDFRKYCHIDVWNIQTTQMKKDIEYHLVRNCVRTKFNPKLSEVKFTGNPTNDEIAKVTNEITDKSSGGIQRFGVILHTKVTGLGGYGYVKKIIAESDENTYTLLDTTKILENELVLLIQKAGKYRLHFYLTDDYNNIEKYTYEFEVLENDYLIDFNVRRTETNVVCELNPNLIPADLTDIQWTVYDCLDNNREVTTGSGSRTFQFTPTYESIYGIKVTYIYLFDGKQYTIDKPEVFSNFELKDEIILL